MDDFISLGKDKQKTEEFDVLKLTVDSPTDKNQTDKSSFESVDSGKSLPSAVKPFYPRCKRILTRAPFRTATAPQPSTLQSTSSQPAKSQPADSAPKCAAQPPQNGAAAKTDTTTNGHHVAKSTSSVAQISLQQLMSVDEKEELPAKKTAVDTDERLVRLRNMLKQAEAEKVTLRGYVADLQTKLAAVPKRTASKCSEVQTDENG